MVISPKKPAFFLILALLILAGCSENTIIPIDESFWTENNDVVSYAGSGNVTGNMTIGELEIKDNGTHYIIG